MLILLNHILLLFLLLLFHYYIILPFIIYNFSVNSLLSLLDILIPPFLFIITCPYLFCPNYYNLSINLTEKDIIYKKEYKEKNKEKTHCSKVPAEKSIDYRPKEANNRSEYGHWEGNFVVGKDGKESALLTFTERNTREGIIMKIPSKYSKNVAKELDILEKK